MELKLRLPWQKKADSSMDVLREWLKTASTKTGIAVNWQTALQAGTALACARVIAEGIAQVPLKVFLERSDGGSDLAKNHSLYDVLHTKPNDWQTSFEWREMSMLHLVFAGRAYSYINRVKGEIVELLPLMPSAVTTKRDGYTTKYTVRLDDGTSMNVKPENMLHMRGPSWNGWEGLDGVKLAQEAIGLSIATEEHGAKMFKNGATIPGVLTTEQNLGPDQREALKDSFRQSQAGIENAWKVLLLWGGLSYQSAGSTNDKAQFLETRAFQVEEVCRAFRVLPIMVGHSDKASTYASAVEMFTAHVRYTLNPWCERLEQRFAVDLLSKEERLKGYYAKFNLNGLLRGTPKERALFYKVMREIGALNANEIRSLEEYNPYEGGDEYRVPMNTETPGKSDLDKDLIKEDNDDG